MRPWRKSLSPPNQWLWYNRKKNRGCSMSQKRITNSKPIPHIPLPFKEVMADVLKVKPPDKALKKGKTKQQIT